jgi:CDP-glycerol glycerophosphotransferase
MRKIESLIKNNSFVQKTYIFCGSLFFRFIAIFIPIKKKTILFSSMSGNNFEYSSPYILYRRIAENYGPEYEYIWAFSKKQKASSYAGKKVRIDSFRYFLYVLKAGIWITDVNIERGLKLKRKKQYYVDTWHGGLSKGYPGRRKDYDLRKVDIFCSDGPRFEAFFIEHYKVRKEAFLRGGRPREDSIFSLLGQRETIRSKAGFTKSSYLILYMPTWREKDPGFVFDPSSLLDSFPDAIILYHAHNLSSQAAGSFGDRFIDVSFDNDLNKLYVMADLLISDYSSCINDFLLTGKPAVLFAPDYDDYKKARGLAIDYEREFPLGISRTQQELKTKIDIVRTQDLTQEFNLFLGRIVSRGENATEGVISRMLSDGALNYIG